VNDCEGDILANAQQERIRGMLTLRMEVCRDVRSRKVAKRSCSLPRSASGTLTVVSTASKQIVKPASCMLLTGPLP